MAGSLSHIVNDRGYFTMESIENLGDAHEALLECFTVIRDLSHGDVEIINEVLERHNFPELECDHMMEYDEDEEEV